MQERNRLAAAEGLQDGEGHPRGRNRLPEGNRAGLPRLNSPEKGPDLLPVALLLPEPEAAQTPAPSPLHQHGPPEIVDDGDAPPSEHLDPFLREGSVAPAEIPNDGDGPASMPEGNRDAASIAAGTLREDGHGR